MGSYVVTLSATRQGRRVDSYLTRLGDWSVDKDTALVFGSLDLALAAVHGLPVRKGANGLPVRKGFRVSVTELDSVPLYRTT